MKRRSEIQRLRYAAAFGALFTALSGAALARAVGPHELPAKFRHGRLALLSLSVGYPNDGWQVRAKRLTNTPELHVRASSRTRRYGHPSLVLMLQRSARDVAKAAPGSVLLVADLSARGGGRISGHHSHQSGRDADVAFYMTDLHGKRIRSKELVAFDADGKAKDESPRLFDDERNWFLVESWVRDRRAGLSHIFVSTPLRKRLLAFARRTPRFARYADEAAALLMQPENAESHDDHFHVRIACPAEEAEICRSESRLGNPASDASPGEPGQRLTQSR